MVLPVVDRNAKRPAVSSVKSAKSDASVNSDLVPNPNLECVDNTDPCPNNTPPKSARWNLARKYIVGPPASPKNGGLAIGHCKTTRVRKFRGVVVHHRDPAAEPLLARGNNPPRNTLRRRTKTSSRHKVPNSANRNRSANRVLRVRTSIVFAVNLVVNGREGTPSPHKGKCTRALVSRCYPKTVSNGHACWVGGPVWRRLCAAVTDLAPTLATGILPPPVLPNGTWKSSSGTSYSRIAPSVKSPVKSNGVGWVTPNVLVVGNVTSRSNLRYTSGVVYTWRAEKS